MQLLAEPPAEPMATDSPFTQWNGPIGSVQMRAYACMTADAGLFQTQPTGSLNCARRGRSSADRTETGRLLQCLH